MSAPHPEILALARELSSLKRQVRAIGTPQLGHSSLEDAALRSYTLVPGEDGRYGAQLGAVIGAQYDGTQGAFTVAGPVPPTPATALVAPVPNGYLVRWSGFFAGDETIVAPMDFTRVEVHASADPEFSGMFFDTLRGEINSPRGGEVFVPAEPDVGMYFRLVARTAAGKASLASGAVGPIHAGKVAAESLDIDFEALRGTKVHTGPDTPVTTRPDLWLKTPANGEAYVAYRYDVPTETWIELQDQGVVAALQEAASASDAAADALTAALGADAAADAAANVAAGKTTSIPSATAPSSVGRVVGDEWIETDQGNRRHVWNGTEWAPILFGNSAIAPQSLVASDVIATGTVTAALLEAILVLATTIIAGNPDGDHARMTATGFRVYRASEVAGQPPEEVVRMGTDTNDYFGIVDAARNLVASVDDTGAWSGRAGNFSEDLRVGGRDVRTLIDESTTGAVVGRWRDYLPNKADLGPIRDEVGIVETNAFLDSNRVYEIRWRCGWKTESHPSEAIFHIRSTVTPTDGGDVAPDVLITSHEEDGWNKPQGGANYWNVDEGGTRIYPGRTGRHRFALTAQQGANNGGSLWILGNHRIDLSIVDMGPKPPQVGTLTRAGGTLYQGPPPPPPPPPTQQYYVDLGSVGRASYQGNGAHMNWVGGDLYQGWNSTNGDTRSQAWFDLPNITGTVDRVDVYFYFRHWYFNSGGTVIMNISDQRGLSATPYKLRGDWHTGGWPKPGGRTVTVPPDWFPFFKGTNNNNYNGRATVLTLGPSGGTNQAYYGVATDVRLRIWYTQ